MEPELVEVFAAEGGDPVVVQGSDFGVADVRLAVGGRVIDTWGTRGSHEGVLVPLHGDFQAENAAIAVETVETFLDRQLSGEVVEEGFAGVELVGRVQVVAHQPLVILDGAHNPDALESLAGTLDEDFAVLGSRFVVFAMMEGRDPAAAAAAVAQMRPDVVVCTTIEGSRSLPVKDLAAAFESAGLPTETFEDPATAIASALRHAGEEDMVLICGSFYLHGVAVEVLASSPE
jgi:dihydrofolate synthase/folylpolyglutamate synthase